MVPYQDIFDSHAHYDDQRFDGLREEVLTRLPHNGVSAVMNAACDLASCQTSIALCDAYHFFYCSVGIHPHEAQHAPPDYLETIRQFTVHPKVKAIGEIGLDYHYTFSPRPIQQRIFEQQLCLASELSLPVIIHSRDATADMLTILKKYRPKGVVHCFSGCAETAQELLKLGLYIGFTGMVTFPNAKKVHDAILTTPLDRLLLETDCPYMAPVPHRGKICTSDMIAFTAEKIATSKGISPQELIHHATHNTKQCFNIL